MDIFYSNGQFHFLLFSFEMRPFFFVLFFFLNECHFLRKAHYVFSRNPNYTDLFYSTWTSSFRGIELINFSFGFLVVISISWTDLTTRFPAFFQWPDLRACPLTSHRNEKRRNWLTKYFFWKLAALLHPASFSIILGNIAMTRRYMDRLEEEEKLICSSFISQSNSKLY